ncbi:MAG: von Willebrand factor A [Candidatus Parvibacillus calidus]|nr:MAG: von Willebrand factor A [Candidatus Parvibacillus calidus]
MSELIADFSEDRKADLLKKWSLILSANPAKDEDFEGVEWSDEEETIDKALTWVYGDGGAGSSNRNFSVNDWLREVDFYFPNSVSTVLQKDAIKRYGLELLLKDDAFLEHIVPDIHLAVSILKMKGLLPDVAKHKARLIVKELARKLTGLFAFQTTQAIGKLSGRPYPIAGRNTIISTGSRPYIRIWKLINPLSEPLFLKGLLVVKTGRKPSTHYSFWLISRGPCMNPWSMLQSTQAYFL